MKKALFISLAALLVCGSANAEDKLLLLPNPQIDAEGFQKLSAEALKYREIRRVDLPTFMEMAKDKNTLVLDARSKRMYDMKHVKGAVNLNFSEFSVSNLAQVIPSKETRVLIYCNNNFNFKNNSAAFFSKGPALSLNIPTFVNLYGYGYKNIYELGPVIDEKNTQLEFEGTGVKS